MDLFPHPECCYDLKVGLLSHCFVDIYKVAEETLILWKKAYGPETQEF